MRRQLARAGFVLAIVAALLGGGAATASAHVQVTPTEAATEDAVKFTVLVPGESSSAETTKVVLKVPRGALPYSFGETPGWTRKLVLAKDQSIGQVVWSGRLATDGFAEFSFLAATPPQPTTLAWKALQYYSDGSVVRWIGGPDSEDPAARTVVSADAPLQNAGGEGASGSGAEAAAAPVADQSGDAEDGTDWLARGLVIAALLAALATLAAVLLNRKERP
jgi:uncharacterized protein YcnI